MRTMLRLPRVSSLPGAMLALLGLAACVSDSSVAPPHPVIPDSPSAALIPPILASIDQAQPSTAGPGANTLAIGGGSAQRLAQGFTVGRAGRLVGVSLPTGCSVNGVRIDIQGVTATGAPDGTNRAIGFLLGFLAPSVVAEPPNFIFIRTFPQIAVAVGARLAMVVTSPGTCGVLQGPLGDSYAGGSAFFDALPNTPGVWVPFSAFPAAHEDLAFQTWVR